MQPQGGGSSTPRKPPGLPGVARSAAGCVTISRSPLATCPRLVDPAGIEVLADLVLVAWKNAMARLAERRRSVLGELSGILGGLAGQAGPNRDAGCPPVTK